MAIEEAAPRSIPITLADVAQKAGVSLATASKALNGRRDVGAATRARVQAVAAELGFVPNEMARSLMSGRTQTVGILTDDLVGRFAIPIMLGVEDALSESETIALTATTAGDERSESQHLQALLHRRVDGLVLVGFAPEARRPLTGAVGVPVVYVYAPSTSAHDISVVPDHRGHGRLATEHLLAQGRRKLAHIAGPLHTEGGYSVALLRLAGFHDALSEHGLQPVGGASATGQWSEQWGWEEAERLIRASGPVGLDGLVCANDQIARGALDRLVADRIQVPGQVAVVGFDNTVALTALGRRQQSSVDQNLQEVGRLAAQAALRPGTLGPGQHLVAGKIVVRESSVAGPAATR